MLFTIKKNTLFILAGLLFASSLSAQQYQLWYEQPALKWTEALPLGNGRIGAMVFGGVGTDRIQFNEETLWTGGPRNYNRKGAWQYLDTIRQLLFDGKQRDAELLAGKEFMGLKSNEGDKEAWLKKMKNEKWPDGKPSEPGYDDKNWNKMQVPVYDGWEAAGFDGLDGAIWLRTSFNLPADWAGKNLVLDLNRIRDEDDTYINGILAGTQNNTEPRKYLVKKEWLQQGKNVIAIQVINYFDKGGITGYKDTARHIGIYPEDMPDKKLSLNGEWKYFVQNNTPPPVGVYQASYQPFGDLILQFAHTDASKISGYRRSLDISTAVASTSYNYNSTGFTREYFISAPDQVMAVKLTCTKKAAIHFTAALSSPHQQFILKKLNNNTLVLNLQVRNGALKGESRLQIIVQEGNVKIENNKIVVSNATAATLYLTAGTNYKNYNDVTANPAAPCIKALQAVAPKSYEQVKKEHIAEYQSYYNRFYISMGTNSRDNLPTDKRLEQFASNNDGSFTSLYAQYGRYLLIAASRPGTGPANLQGIWNDLITPPWGSKYTTNINAEMNYWPAELLNLSETHEPLFKMIEEVAVTGAVTAKEYYNAPGWVLHHNTDLWRGTAAINNANHGIWVTGGAWLCQHLWERYLYSQDKLFLKNKAYPLMKKASLFFNSFLVPDPVTGYLISTPSNSPEQGGLVAGPTMDHQIIRELFKNTIEAARILNVDAAFCNTLQDKYQRIAPNKIGHYGQLQEWMQDVDDTANKHRHVSHLWGVHPGNDINWETAPEMMKAARQSLEYRGDEATGWSLGWKINLWARFKNAERTYKLIKMLLSPSAGGAGSYPNLLDAHPPFQIDGNYGGAAGIAEMLLQSHAGYIELLPALPAALSEGEVKGLCARGAFVIDFKWKQHQLESITIVSKAGQPLHLRYGPHTIKLNTVKGKKYQFNGALQQQ